LRLFRVHIAPEGIADTLIDLASWRFTEDRSSRDIKMSDMRFSGHPTRRHVLAGATGTLAALASWRARAAGPSVKVGAIMPSSGVLAFPGQACVRGIDFGAKFAREHFGLSLEVLHADTQSRPENGRLAAESLIRQGCNVLVGAFDSGATISALQAAEAAKVPMVVHIASATQVTSQGFTQVFRYYPMASVIVRQALSEMKALVTSVQDPPTSAALLHLSNTMGTSTATSIDATWSDLAMPIKLVAHIPFDEKARDLSVEVAKAKATGADALVAVTRVNDAVMIVRECVKQGWNPKMIFSPNGNGVTDKAFYDALGKYADGSMSSVVWYNPSNADARKIVDRFETEYSGQWLDSNSGCAFEAMQIVADAVVRAKSSEPAAIHSALKATDMEPILMYGGPIKFDETGQNINGTVAVIQAKGDRPQVVAPSKIAVAKTQYPLVPFSSR
jgi:branched-chain amino acid transport system substrate-binding protein